MIDLRKIRDAVLEAIANLPIAAAWLYPASGSKPGISVAILQAGPIIPGVLWHVGKSLQASVGIDPVITRMQDCSPPHAGYIIKYGALIADNDPAVREAFIASTAAAEAAEAQEREAIRKGLRELGR